MQRLRICALAAVAMLAGCATYPTDRGVEPVRGMVAQRGGAVPPDAGPQDCDDPGATTPALALDPLSPDAAIQIALLCNPALAAQYARLGIANAQVNQAQRLTNPTLTAAALDSSARGAPAQVQLGIVQNFTNILLRGPRSRLAAGEFARTQQLLAGSVLNLAADVKAAYFRLVAAQQVARLRQAIADAAQTSADLAERYRDAGNLTAREFAQRRAAAAQALIDARSAADEVAAAHATLALALGLAPQRQRSVPDALPLPVVQEDALDALLARADGNRLDLAAARKLVSLLADSEALARKYRWLGEFELGLAYERDPDRSRLLGPTLSIQLPIFDQGTDAIERAAALARWSQAEQRRLTLEVANAVQMAHQRVHNARARAEAYGTQLIPQREAVVARTQEEVNFMLTGVFELIASKREEFAAYQGYLEALRDYWIARAELERAVGAALPSDADADSARIGTGEWLAPPQAPNESPHPGHHRGADAPQGERP